MLDEGNFLIVAPTATGKSHIGREVIRRAVKGRADETHAYLVPYRALADEMYDSFVEELVDRRVRVRIATGDYRDPVRPEEADLVVATYESFGGLLRSEAFRPGVVVADEVHLVADETRGPFVEGLFARLLAAGQLRRLCALSAVVENGPELASWLGVPLVTGTASDRAVPLTVECRVTDDVDATLLDVLAPCLDGEQALVFCRSKGAAEGEAKRLAGVIGPSVPPDARGRLDELALRIWDEDPDAEDVVDLLPDGVAYHHAGLPRPLRREIERAFRDQLLRVIACTPTLAAGVNLPANLAVVRDVFRTENARGRWQPVLLPSGEVVNMLGRAGRPNRVNAGVGIALVQADDQARPGVSDLEEAVQLGRGQAVESRLADRFESLMRFVLALVVERGEASELDIIDAFRCTLAHHQQQVDIRFDRPLEEDLLEDIPAIERARKVWHELALLSARATTDGVEADVRSRDHEYEVSLRLTDLSCTCPAGSQFFRGKACKHVAFAVHQLLFGGHVDAEVRTRALYTCGQLFGQVIEIGTRLREALYLLRDWGLVQPVGAAWRTTPMGFVAAGSRFDLLLARQAYGRVQGSERADFGQVAMWATEDFIADPSKRAKWHTAVDAWVHEVDAKDFKLPERYRGDFENGLDDLASVCRLYQQAAEALGKAALAATARDAALALRYGVAPELVPLMALGLPLLGRARSRSLYEHGVRDLDGLASVDPETIADPRRMPLAVVRGWIARATEIRAAKGALGGAVRESDAAVDELVARFRVDRAAFE